MAPQPPAVLERELRTTLKRLLIGTILYFCGRIALRLESCTSSIILDVGIAFLIPVIAFLYRAATITSSTVFIDSAFAMLFRLPPTPIAFCRWAEMNQYPSPRDDTPLSSVLFSIVYALSMAMGLLVDACSEILRMPMQGFCEEVRWFMVGICIWKFGVLAFFLARCFVRSQGYLDRARYI
ncbi:hypothetical protein HII31_01687 [Pseudocercospora fuligena]|uniref:Uncharacterized protein n=1 Tax=Pseudocercospora fuligena TaxID=685502 RepID=A0A8H6RU90_9PEZI|nr:hypothetical protein HII31_01687 [Pseudocercospora fuligena]